MAVAKIYPKGNQRKKTSSETEEVVSSTRLSMSRTVLRYAPKLADNVLGGSATLDEAHSRARERRETTCRYDAMRYR
jgi:hypothetical protein